MTDIESGKRQGTYVFVIRASMPVQWFLAYRMRVLSHSFFFYGGIFQFSLTQGACGIAGGILAMIIGKCVNHGLRMFTRIKKLMRPPSIVLQISRSLLVVTSWLSLTMYFYPLSSA